MLCFEKVSLERLFSVSFFKLFSQEPKESYVKRKRNHAFGKISSFSLQLKSKRMLHVFYCSFLSLSLFFDDATSFLTLNFLSWMLPLFFVALFSWGSSHICSSLDSRRKSTTLLLHVTLVSSVRLLCQRLQQNRFKGWWIFVQEASGMKTKREQY